MNGPIGQTYVSSKEIAALGLHVAVFMPGERVLGNETFRLVSFQGQESMSEPFEYNLELHGNTDNVSGSRIDFSVVLGRAITVGISLPGPDSDNDNESDLAFSRAIKGEAESDMALFNGIVASFAMEQPGVYRITMRPALWKLGLSNGYRHFNGKNIREVVSEALNRYGVEHVFRDDVDCGSDISVTRIQDWLQAGESDLELVRRLLGKAHLFYFFEHHGDGHTMVIAGGETAYGHVYSDHRPLRYTWSSADELGMEQEDVLLQYSYQETLTSSHVSGTYVRQQAVWDVDGVAGYQPYPPDGSGGDLPFNQYKVFQYGLSHQEANYLTKIAENALDASRSQLSGSSRCPRFSTGKLFSVSGSDAGDGLTVRPSLEGHQYVLTMVKHQASLDGSYQNEFQALPKAPVLPFSLQDTQQGSVLAKVVPGEPKDWRYYPRSVFDPQTDVEIDLQADPKMARAKGVTVELATGTRFWARLPVHTSSAPEVGSMVVVSRANDESELPEISLISSDGSMTVTPSGWTAHSSVGNSYSTSWGDSKSIRCGAATPDVLDEARGIVEGAYQSGQYKDSSYSRGGSYGYSTSENGRSGLLSRSASYGNTYNTQEADETKSWSDVGYSYSESTVGESYSKSTVTTSVSTLTTGSSVATNLTGSSISTSLSASNINTNISASNINTNITGSTVDINIVGSTNTISVKGPVIDIDIEGTLVLHMDEAEIKIHVPGIEIKIDDGLELHL